MAFNCFCFFLLYDLIYFIETFFSDSSNRNSLSNQVLSIAEQLQKLKNESDETKALKKKFKELSESTAKACKALSGGLSDLHTTNLSILSWADRAHIAIGICADRIGLHGNPCPSVPNLNMHGGPLSMMAPSSPSQGAFGGASVKLLSRSRSFSNSPSDVRRSKFGLDS